MTSGHSRAARAGVAALAITIANTVAVAPARAQMPPPFPIPIPGEVVLLPLLLLVVPLGIHLNRSDEKRVREFEARDDWDGLAAFAAKRLAEHPDDVHWHEVRGRALQRLGRCTEAIPELRRAADARTGSDDAAYAAGLALGLCELLVWDLPAAERTMQRLAALAPARAEPRYSLGVLHALQGDDAAAGQAQQSLQALQPPLAAALQTYRDAVAARRAPAPAADASAAAATPVAAPDVRLADGRLEVGRRALRLPPGTWTLAAATSDVARGSRIRSGARLTEVTLRSAHAYALGADRRLAAAAVFSSNTEPAWGVSFWDADNPCRRDGAVHAERFRSGYERPECLRVRIVGPGAAAPAAELAPVLEAARQAGASLAPLAYELQYVRYGMDWAVASTWWLPLHRLAGDLAAVQWGRALAAQLQRMAIEARAPAAELPAPGPE